MEILAVDHSLLRVSLRSPSGDNRSGREKITVGNPPREDSTKPYPSSQNTRHGSQTEFIRRVTLRTQLLLVGRCVSPETDNTILLKTQ